MSDATADHANLHRQENAAVIAIETAVGTTAGTGVLKNFATGDLAARINQETLGSATLIGGTIKNPTVGTPTIVLGSDAQGDLLYRSSGGTLTRLAAGTANQFLKTQGAATNPVWSGLGIGGYSVLPTGTQTIVGTSYLPLANGTISVPVTQVSNVFVMLNGIIQDTTGGAYAYMQAQLNGTTIGVEGYSYQGQDQAVIAGGMGTSIAVGTYNLIAQGKASSGTSTYYKTFMSVLVFPTQA